MRRTALASRFVLFLVTGTAGEAVFPVPSVSAQEPGPRISHGLPVPEPGSLEKFLGFEWEGSAELGARAVDGYNAAYKSMVNRSPGPRLAQASLQGRGRSASFIDTFDLRILGVGDPGTQADLNLGRSGAWDLNLYMDRYEDLFDWNTELHNRFIVRKNWGASFEVARDADSSWTFGWDRTQISEDVAWSRYRPVSNAFFDNVPGDRFQSGDLLYVQGSWRREDWSFHWKQTLRWWQDRDNRFLFDSLSGPNDMEDFRARSNALTPASSFQVEGELLDGRMLVDAEVFLAYSSRDYRSESESSGEATGGSPPPTFTGSSFARGGARGRYARFETGALYEFSEDLGAELRLRYRYDREDARSTLDDDLTINGSPSSTTTLEESRALHRTFDIETALQTQFSKTLRGAFGYGVRLENLDVTGPRAGSVDPVDHGVLLELEAKATKKLTLDAEVRAYTISDPYTALTPENSARAKVDARWNPETDLAIQGGASLDTARLSADNSESDVTTVYLLTSVGTTEDLLQWGLRGSWQDYKSEVSTIAQPAGFPVLYVASFEGGAISANGWVLLNASSSLDFRFGSDWTQVRGDNGSTWWDAYLQASHALGGSWVLHGGVTWYDLEAGESPADDFSALVVEASVEYLF